MTDTIITPIEIVETHEPVSPTVTDPEPTPCSEKLFNKTLDTMDKFKVPISFYIAYLTSILVVPVMAMTGVFDSKAIVCFVLASLIALVCTTLKLARMVFDEIFEHLVIKISFESAIPRFATNKQKSVQYDNYPRNWKGLYRSDLTGFVGNNITMWDKIVVGLDIITGQVFGGTRFNKITGIAKVYVKTINVYSPMPKIVAPSRIMTEFTTTGRVKADILITETILHDSILEGKYMRHDGEHVVYHNKQSIDESVTVIQGGNVLEHLTEHLRGFSYSGTNISMTTLHNRAMAYLRKQIYDNTFTPNEQHELFQLAVKMLQQPTLTGATTNETNNC